MSLLAIVVACVAAIAAGVRRSKYDGVPWRVWWATERMHRRPLHILGRLLKVVLGAACLVGTFIAVFTLVGVVLAVLFAAFLLVATWYGLRLAARASTPHVYPVERLDLAPDDPDTTGPIPVIVLPRTALPPATDAPGMEV